MSDETRTDSPSGSPPAAAERPSEDFVDDASLLAVIAYDMREEASSGDPRSEFALFEIASRVARIAERLPSLLGAALENERLRRFAGRALKETRIDDLGDWNGGDIEDAMLETGLLEVVRVTEPCGEGCRCVEYDDFPQNCNHVTALGKACYASAVPSLPPHRSR